MAAATANSTIARYNQISEVLVKFVTETIKVQTQKRGDVDLASAAALGAVMSLLQHEVALGSIERQERLESDLKERVRLLSQDGLPTPQSIFRS
jgi:hypothetical protein